MRILWQPAQLDPQAWREIDSVDWRSIEGNPEGLEVGTGPGAYCNAIAVQGITFQGADHYAVEHLAGGGIRVWTWFDDSSIWSPGQIRARVVEIFPLAPDPLLGGAWNTRQREIWYGRPGGEVETRFLRDGPWSSVEFRPWDRFLADLPDVNVLHGKLLELPLLAGHADLRTRHGWREWTEGVDPRVIDPRTGRVSRSQAKLGLRAPKLGTYTRYLGYDTAGVAGHTLSLELTTLKGPASAQTRSWSVDPTTAQTRDVGWSFGGPGSGGTNPNGLYQCQLDCTVNDGYSFGIKTINSVTGHFCIVNGVDGTHIDSWEQTEGTHTGTGVKTCSRTLNPIDGAFTDSYQAICVHDHPAGHGGGTDVFSLELNEADDLIEGPWDTPPTTATLQRPALAMNAQSLTAVPGALSVGLDKATLQLLAQAITGDPGGGDQVVGLDLATVQLVAQTLTAVPGALSVGLDAATLALQAQELAVVLGAISAGLDLATLALQAQDPLAVPGALSVALDRPTLALQAQDLSVVLGALAVELSPATLQLLAQAITSGQAVGLDAATLQLVAQAVTWSNPFFVVLQRPTLAFQARDLGAVPGGISAALDAATLQLLAQGISAGLVVSLDPATLALQAQDLSFVPGATSKALSRPFLTISTRSISYVPGATSKALEAATLQLLAQEATALPGPISRGLAAATLQVLAQSPSASPGPLAVVLERPTLQLLAQELGVVSAGQVVALDVATLQLVAQAISAAGFGEVVVLDPALLRFYAFPVLTEGLVEQDVEITATAQEVAAFLLVAPIAPAFRSKVAKDPAFTSEVVEQ